MPFKEVVRAEVFQGWMARLHLLETFDNRFNKLVDGFFWGICCGNQGGFHADAGDIAFVESVGIVRFGNSCLDVIRYFIEKGIHAVNGHEPDFALVGGDLLEDTSGVAAGEEEGVDAFVLEQFGGFGGFDRGGVKGGGQKGGAGFGLIIYF